MVARGATCDLCGLELGASAVSSLEGGSERRFCCPGCARVYAVAGEAGLLDQVLPAQRAAAHAGAGQAATRALRTLETARFSVQGMWCSGCACAAERILLRQPGVLDAEVSFAAGMGRVRYDAGQVNPAGLMEALDGLGYRARLLGSPLERREDQQQEHMLLQLVTAAGFGMQVMVIYIQLLYPMYAEGRAATDEARRLHYLVWLLTTPILFYGSISFLKGAWRALRALTATMDTLVAVGTLSAYSYSAFVTVTGSGETYFDSVGMISTFVMLGRYLELLGGARARKNLGDLLKLQPDKAWRAAGDAWQQVPAASLSTGDHILVKPGERAPADAEILTGDAAVDESLLTGESVPVLKQPGEVLLAGSVVTDGALTGRVTQPPRDSRLAQIAGLVEQALSTKPPIQRLADRASAWFTLGILAIAVLTALGWMITGHTPAQSVLTSVAVLVVACPCALGLATPLATTIAVGRAAQAGVIVRSPLALETALQLDRLVLDKTGTLTQGRMSVARVEASGPLAGEDHGAAEGNLLRLAAAVEQYSDHPIAAAIVAASPGALLAADAFKMHRGLGASASVRPAGGVGEPTHVAVGSASFLGLDETDPLAATARLRAARGETLVWVLADNVPAGFIALRDEVEPTAAGMLKTLSAQGIRQVMLSGDNPLTVASVAETLGLDAFDGGQSPARKLEKIREWQRAGERVGMVGDGVNDAPALAQADLSITVAGGADIAGSTSDVVLMRRDLALIPWFIGFSRRTRRVIRENLAWAFAYNVVSVSLAVVGAITPVIAAAAMAASSLMVVANSLRLQR